MAKKAKTYAITLDMFKDSYVDAPVLVCGDSGNVFTITLVDGSSAFSATGCDIVITISSKSGSRQLTNGTDANVTIADNVLTVTIPEGCYDIGANICDVAVYSSDGINEYKVTSAWFLFSGRASLSDGTASENAVGLDILHTLIKAIENVTASTTTLSAQSAATATASITNQALTFLFGLPQGADGADGTNGTKWFSGTAVAGTGTGISATVSGSVAGDYYLNTTTAAIYVATAANVWSYLCTVSGAPQLWAYSLDTLITEGFYRYISDVEEYIFVGSYTDDADDVRIAQIRMNTYNNAQVQTRAGVQTGGTGSVTWSAWVSGLDRSDLITSLSAASTDATVPSAKCVYDNLATKANFVDLGTDTTRSDILSSTIFDTATDMNTIYRGAASYNNTGYSAWVFNTSYVLSGVSRHRQVMLYNAVQYARVHSGTAWGAWTQAATESLWNKITAITLDNATSTTYYPSAKATVDYVADHNSSASAHSTLFAAKQDAFEVLNDEETAGDATLLDACTTMGIYKYFSEGPYWCWLFVSETDNYVSQWLFDGEDQSYNSRLGTITNNVVTWGSWKNVSTAISAHNTSASAHSTLLASYATQSYVTSAIAAAITGAIEGSY